MKTIEDLNDALGYAAYNNNWEMVNF